MGTELRPRRRDLRLDGIRGIAVLLVLFYHCPTPQRLLPFDSRLLPGGWLGVPVFFVLSGYLITRLLLDEWRTTGTLDRRSFYARRAARLLPALAVLLAVWLTVTLSGLLPVQLLGSSAPSVGAGLALVPAVGTLALAYNWLLAFDLPTPTGMGQLWTLSVEEQFYLALPAVILLVGSRSRRPERELRRLVTAGAVISVLLAALATIHGYRDAVYFSTPTAGLGILLGAAIAIRPPRRRRGGLALVGLATILALALVVPDDRPLALPVASTAVSLAAVLVVAHGGGRSDGFLAAAWLRWAGRRSYAIYLWSSPIAYAAVRWGGPTWAMDAVVVATSLVLAELSWWLVERRFLVGAKRRRKPLGLGPAPVGP